MGLSLIYKGLDKYEEHEVGVFVARVVPGGQSQRAGLKENDRILKINNKVPANVNDAVSFIKKAGRSLILSVERAEPHEELQEGRLSRSGSVRSFNTAYGASRPQSPGDSEGEEDEVTRHQRMMAAHQAELQAKEAAIAEQERRLQSQRAEQERQARLLEQERQSRLLEQERAEQMRLHQLQQESIMTAIPTYSASTLVSSRKTISVMQSATRPKLTSSLEMLRTVKGILGQWLLCQLVSSNGVVSRRNPAGSQVSKVLWKHDVKSGSSVFHVTLEFQKSPPQNSRNPVISEYISIKKLNTEAVSTFHSS